MSSVSWLCTRMNAYGASFRKQRLMQTGVVVMRMCLERAPGRFNLCDVSEHQFYMTFTMHRLRSCPGICAYLQINQLPVGSRLLGCVILCHRIYISLMKKCV